MPQTVPTPPKEYDERLEVLRRRYREAREAGLTRIEAARFAESGADIGLLRKMVANKWTPRQIEEILRS